MANGMNDMQRPPMPDMAGANMPRPQARPQPQPQSREMPPEAKANMMKPSPQLAAVLISRLGSMTEEQLDELDRAIGPEAARALLILLPELGELMEAIKSGTVVETGARDAMPAGAQMDEQMGALGGMA